MTYTPNYDPKSTLLLHTVEEPAHAQQGANRFMSIQMVASEKATLLIAPLSPATSSCSSRLSRGRRGSAVVAPPPAFFSLSFANSNVQMSTRLDMALCLSLSLLQYFVAGGASRLYIAASHGRTGEDARMISRRSWTVSVIQGVHCTQNRTDSL